MIYLCIGADITREDGVYSGYYLGFTKNGKYSVKILADNEIHTASIKVSRRVVDGGAPPVQVLGSKRK